MYNLRPYQEEAVKSVVEEWGAGNRRTLLVMPTGSGKTICFANITKKRLEDPDSRVLILAHRGELLTQAADKLKSACGIHAAIEKAEETTVGKDERVVIGSVQSMAGRRLESFPVDYFTDIIIDEAHHSVAETYQRVLERFPNANVVGVTATPNRSDKKSLSRFYDTTAYEYTLRQAIDDGYLSPITVQCIPIQIDISRVSMSAGDYAAGEVGNALEPYLDAIATKMASVCRDRKTIVFTPLVKTSKLMAEVLERHGFRAAEVNGLSKDREEILKDFEEGRYDVLLNSMLLTEGFDCPSVDCIVNLRPTKSSGLYFQIIGRGTRLHPGKENLLILDFLWQTGRRDLCHPSALVATDDDIAMKMCRIIEESEGAVSLKECEELAIEQQNHDRELALARQLEICKRNQKKTLDTAQFFASIGRMALYDYEPIYAWEEDPPTEKQAAYLEKLGFDMGDVPNKGVAKKIIDICIKRVALGLSTVKQIKLLERYGFVRVGKWTFEEASEMIDKIAKSGWNVPYGTVPAAYRPERLRRKRA